MPCTEKKKKFHKFDKNFRKTDVIYYHEALKITSLTIDIFFFSSFCSSTTELINDKNR